MVSHSGGFSRRALPGFIHDGLDPFGTLFKPAWPNNYDIVCFCPQFSANNRLGSSRYWAIWPNIVACRIISRKLALILGRWYYLAQSEDDR